MTKYLSQYREIFRLGLPILIGQLGMIAMMFADNIMVGRYSTDALASASFVGNVFNIPTFCIMGFTYGLTPLAGALFSAGRRRAIGALVRRGLWMTTLYAAVIIAAMSVLYFYLDRIGQPAHLLPLIRPYFLTYLAGMLPMALFSVFMQWSYAIGDTATPTWIVLASNALNVIGNYTLIFGHFGAPEMGLLGAGISTLCSRTFCLVVIVPIYFLHRKNAKYRQGFVHGAQNPVGRSRIFRTGFPVSMQMTFETAAFSGAAVMAGWLGTIQLAAFQIIVITGTLGFCIYYSIGAAVTVMVSHAAGQHDAGLMRRCAWAGYHVTLLLAAVASATFILFGRHIMGLFSQDPAVLATAVTLIFPLVLYQLGDATQINFASALRGTSRVMPMLWIALVSYVIIGLPSTYLIGIHWGLDIYGIILSFSVSLFVAGALFLTYFLRATTIRD